MKSGFPIYIGRAVKYEYVRKVGRILLDKLCINYTRRCYAVLIRKKNVTSLWIEIIMYAIVYYRYFSRKICKVFNYLIVKYIAWDRFLVLFGKFNRKKNEIGLN